MIGLLIVTAVLTSLTQSAPPETYGVSLLDGRIVGGEPTVIEKHPYQVSLQLLSYHRCGGVIISKDYVLTAAHCTDYMYTSRILISSKDIANKSFAGMLKNYQYVLVLVFTIVVEL